ncbi:MAG: arylsulfatase, partial [Bacteroides sp.]|nr:arylsulfatase [Bacteroides sp.]
MKIIGFMLAAALLLTSCQSDKKSEEMPNIIVVLADDLGYGDLSTFNPESKILTPQLDRMAAEGMRFTDAHTSSSVCTPTRYGLLTGRYNWRTRLKSGVLSGISEALIPADRSTLASMLKASGYHTAFIGKWHLGWDWAIQNPDQARSGGYDMGNLEIDYSAPVSNGPAELGFDYSYGHCGSLDMAPYVYVENGMVTAPPDRITQDTGYRFWRKGPTGSDFIHEDVTPNFFRRAIELVKQRSSEEQPFFLYLALPSPHTPILPTEQWLGKSELNPYGDFVLMVDDYMGQLLKAIEESGIGENTLVVFTSDNGCSPMAKFDVLEEKGHHPSYIYRGHKADIFEGGHRVPFIVKWPAGVKPGTESDEVICTTDLFRTFASLTGYKTGDDEGEDSYDISTLFSEPAPEAPLREATVHHSING